MVEHRHHCQIGKLPIQHKRVPLYAFQHKPGFLITANRAVVFGRHFQLYALQPLHPKSKVQQQPNGFATDAFAPLGFAAQHNGHLG